MKRPKSRTYRSTGALTFLLVCLLVSGFARFSGGQYALAKEVTGLASSADPAPGSHADVVQNCDAGDNPGPLLEAIRERQSGLEARESRLANRIQALQIAEHKIKENTAALIKAEKRLASTLAIADEAAENDLKNLTSVYENMKSKNAALLFGEMAPEFAAGFLGRMRSDAAAGIMSNLTPEKAYTISLILAGRNARAPSQ